MAKKSNCESCGQCRNLRMQYGMMVCASCSTMRTACKHRRDTVIDSLVELAEDAGQIKPEIAAEYWSLKRLQKEVAGFRVMRNALETLARLGNEPFLGNSNGNIIAIEALRRSGVFVKLQA